MCAAALPLALACGGSGDDADGTLTGTSRAVQGVNARAKLIGGGSIALLLGNPLDPAAYDKAMVSAQFFDPASNDGRCRDRSLDGCTVSTCTGIDFMTPLAWSSAGSITLDNGPEPVVLVPDEENRYPSIGEWQSGDVVAISVEGDVVPGFTSQAEIPERLVVSKPAFETSFDFGVDRGAGLELAWSGGGSASVEVVIMQGAVTGLVEATNVVCRFPAAQGGGRITPAVLGNLSDLATAQVTIAAVHGRVERAGALAVEVEGASYPFFGRATFR